MSGDNVQQVREAYNSLVELLEEITHLNSINYLLTWDKMAVMPAGASEARGLQSATLAGVMHDKGSNPRIGQLLETLDKLESSKYLDQWEQASVRLARIDYKKHTCVPKKLAQQIANLASTGYEKWVQARKENNWSVFSPVLKEWVQLRTDYAKHLDANRPVYDVLMDEHERGITSEKVDKVFAELKSGLIPLISQIKAKPLTDDSFLHVKCAVDAQAKLAQQITKDLGFDANCGRYDTSVHPFAAPIHITDVRITTRYKETDLVEGLTGIVHESGHAMYEQGRNKKYANLPASLAVSMGIHESQSLLWERMVMLSLPFWERYWPVIQENFPQIPKEISAAQAYAGVNKVVPSFIRVEADEVTYPLHVILRYEIERDLFSGALAVDDVPQQWNLKMEQYLGITPDTVSVGALQDIHWSLGMFGYFPTYTIGAICASQFFAQATKEIPDLSESIRKGEYKILKEWLNKNIHAKGSLFASGDLLMEDVTGEPMNPAQFIKHLTSKYSPLYGL